MKQGLIRSKNNAHVVIFSYKVLVVFVLFASTLPIGTYAYDNLRNTLDHMFAKIDRNAVPTGYLIDYAIEYENLDDYSGNKNASLKQCDVVTYLNIVKTLSSSSFDKTLINQLSSNLYNVDIISKDDAECRLSIIFQDYAQLKANSLVSDAISYENGQVRLNRQDAFLLKKVCAACIIDNIKETNNIEFNVPKNLRLNDIPISDIEVDWGEGFHSIINNGVSATLSDGHHIINVMITDSSGERYYTSTSIDIVPRLVVDNTRSFNCINGFDTEEISGLSYKGIVTKADVTIKLSDSNHSGKIQKPLIFVEGFDPRDLNPNRMGYMNYSSTYFSWSNFIESNGFDFIYVDWQEAGEYIQANAYTLINVINKINSIKDSNSTPGVLIGHSMGGLVARYALKTMENRGQTHNIGTYVSYDSPHMGANVPMGLLYGFHGILKFLKDKNIIDGLLKKYTEVESLIKIGERYAYSPATQQMLVNYVDPMGNPSNYAHIQWQTELNNLGFPNGDIGKEFKKLAIANSDYSPMDVTGKLIHCDFSAGVNTPPVLSPLLSVAVGILFQDVIAGLLTVLPGRDGITGVFDCLPATRYGMTITNINIGYKKDFLWLVPISKTIFSYSKSYSGNCLYDTYPSSYYDYSGSISVTEGNVPIIFDWSSDIQLTPKFAFIPTSSALAVGNGLNNTEALFTVKPNISNLIFDAVRMEDKTNFQTHTSISTDSKDWLLNQLQTVIVGPEYGRNGAKYTLSEQMGPVIWESSDPSLATITEEGVLNVTGNGVVKLTAKVNGNCYSKKVIVGTPKFILQSSHVPGGYQIDANIISSQFKNYSSYVNQNFIFFWGVKYEGKNIKWIDRHSTSILIPLGEGCDNATIFLKIMDLRGYIRSVQSVKAQSTDLFSVTNNILLIDSERNIYKESGSLYSYKNGKIYLTRDTSLPSDYQRDIWTSTKGTVLSPFATSYDFTVTRGEIPIKQVLPEDEINFILQNGELNQTYVYTLALLNPENKVIQFIPVTIKRI